jgi:hypothetical protein
MRKGARTVHNGQFQGNGNGKRWVLIALLVLGGFWLVNDSYDDGYRDALVQSGQTETIRHYQGGPHFPWGLVILGGIGYVAWRKGAFDRFGGPGGLFGNGGNGERGMQRYGAGFGSVQTPNSPPSGQGFGPGFRGPRAFFEEWHRQAHEETARAHYSTPPTPPSPPTGTQNSHQGAPQSGFTPTPPPTPPAPEYWASMAGAAEAATNSGGPLTPPAAPEAGQNEHPDVPHGATGTAV